MWAWDRASEETMGSRQIQGRFAHTGFHLLDRVPRVPRMANGHVTSWRGPFSTSFLDSAPPLPSSSDS